MWIKTGKYILENEGGNGNYSEIYLVDEFEENGAYYILSYDRHHNAKFGKFFYSAKDAEKYFDNLCARLGAEVILNVDKKK